MTVANDFSQQHRLLSHCSCVICMLLSHSLEQTVDLRSSKGPKRKLLQLAYHGLYLYVGNSGVDLGAISANLALLSPLYENPGSTHATDRDTAHRRCVVVFVKAHSRQIKIATDSHQTGL